MLRTESEFFTHWLNRQPEGGMLPNQWRAMINVLGRCTNGDLIRVMFYGDDLAALRALKILRNRFEEDMDAWNDINNYQWESDESDWH